MFGGNPLGHRHFFLRGTGYAYGDWRLFWSWNGQKHINCKNIFCFCFTFFSRGKENVV